VGLLTVRTAAGRVPDALRGYRDVIDYWARAGNWTQQWTTLRNLARLLRELGDDEPAALLDAAADQAPDAPPPGGSAGPGALAARRSPPPHAQPLAPAVGRAGALEVARQAIERHLLGSQRPS
jgi:hypothetical protein